jgi:ketosteroid isomerase-like protein
MRHHACLLGAFLALLLVAPAHSRDDAPQLDQEAVNVARQVLDKGSQLYNAKDAEALAATYTEDAEVAIVSKKPGELKTEFKRGRAEIEELYRSVFATGNSFTSKYTIEYARMLDQDMLLIAGVFEPDLGGNLKVPFVQVRVKQGDRWLMTSLRLFLIDRQR